MAARSELRRSQGVVPFGVGAVIDFKEESLMSAGLDVWPTEQTSGEMRAALLVACQVLDGRLADHEAGDEFFGNARRRARLGDGGGHASGGLIRNGDVLVGGQIGEALCKIGIAGIQRRDDIPLQQRRVIPQRGTEPRVGQSRRIVL